jgi:MFS family permease
LTNAFTERRERALAIGLWGAITGVAIALGPIVGGWLIQISDWRSIFFAMTPVAVTAGVLAARYVPSSRDPRAPRTDRAGFALSTLTIGLFVYTIIEAPNYDWGSPRTLGSFALTGGAGGGVRGLGAAHRTADARPEPVRQCSVHGR